MRVHSLFLQASLLLTAVPFFCLATITVPGTGHRYASRQEHAIGRKLWRGYVYEARLQYIDANPWLCNDHDGNDDNSSDVRYNITVPVDTPVALLVRGGSCSLHEKARTVLDRVYPKGVVRYLIVGSGRRASDPAENVDSRPIDEDSSRTSFHARMNLDGFDEDDEWALPPATLWNPDEERVDRRKHDSDNENKNKDDDSIPLTFLHVSLRTAEELLLDVIRTQTPETEMMGGPRINIDSRLGNGLFDGEAAIWVALSALLSACACSAILLANSNDYLPDEANHAPPTRPQRRRLTREQVKAMFPRYLYTEDGTLQPLLEEIDPEAPGEEMSYPHHHHHHHHHHLPDPHELDCCSICLDEYESGDKLRCLPCHHAFHSKCIGKWLSERSATCPLCKSELHEDDDESSSSEESAQEAAVPAEAEPAFGQREGAAPEETESTGWWDRLHALARSRRNVTVTEPLINEGSNQQFDASQNRETMVGNEQPGADFLRSTWWRRMFPGQRGERTAQQQPVEESPESMLAEPLLAQPQDNRDSDASIQAVAASVEESTEMEMQQTPEPVPFEPRQVTI